MGTEQRWDEEDDPSDPSWASTHVDGAWLRSANPNSADGELQNLAAFGAGLSRLSGRRRLGARIVVWAILIGIALTIIYGIIAIVG